jgi:glucose/arabinose dehydrogenase
VEVEPDLVTFPPYSIPRGLAAYTGTQFPQNLFNSLFVVLWDNTETAQGVIWFPPISLASEREPVGEPFVTGLIRPIDVAVAPDGSLVMADFIYGHIWRVRYAG